MKKIKRILLTLLVASTVTTATLSVQTNLYVSAAKTSTETKKATKKPNINQKYIKIGINDSETLKVENAKGKIKWTSNNKDVATVSKNGKVVGKKQGMQ